MEESIEHTSSLSELDLVTYDAGGLIGSNGD
jgi:hypothetical protein